MGRPADQKGRGASSDAPLPLEVQNSLPEAYPSLVILCSVAGSGASKGWDRLSMYASRASRSLPRVWGFVPSLKTVKPSPPVAIKLLAATV